MYYKNQFQKLNACQIQKLAELLKVKNELRLLPEDFPDIYFHRIAKCEDSQIVIQCIFKCVDLGFLDIPDNLVKDDLQELANYLAQEFEKLPISKIRDYVKVILKEVNNILSVMPYFLK